MRKGITITGGRQPAIRSTTVRSRRIAVDLSKALGGVFVGQLSRRQASPVALLAVRSELARCLRSTGGRPSLQGTARRQKIPMADADWGRLQNLAASVTDTGLRATAGQVASVILRRFLCDLDEPANKAMKQTAAHGPSFKGALRRR